MTEGGGLLVDWSLQIELLDDGSWSEAEVVLDDSDEIVIGHTLLDGSVRVDVDGEWVSETNGVGDLDEASVGEAVGNDGLGDVSSVVGSRSVDLGLILSGESTSTMWAPSTIGVDNNFSSSETGIGGWTTNVELARWVDDDLGVNEHLGWDDLLDDFIGEHLVDGLVGDLRGVLSGDEDVVNSDWLQDTLIFLLILNNNLRFAIWSQPWDLTILSLDSHNLAELVSKNVRVWVEGLLIPLIGGVSEHKSLITGSHVSLVLGSVNGGGDVGILSMDVQDDVAVVGIESDVVAGESNFLADSSGNLLEVNL